MIEFEVNSTQPLAVSSGLEKDLVMLRVKDRKLFVAKATDQMIDKESMVLVKEFPR